MNVTHFRNYTDKQPITTTLNAVVSAIRGEGNDGEKLAALTELSLVDIDHVVSDECLVMNVAGWQDVAGCFQTFLACVRRKKIFGGQ